jgi:hypothetical protein
MSEVFFSGIREKIIENLQESNKNVKIAVAWFTDRKLLKAIENLLDNDIQVDLIIFNDHINKKDLYENIYYKGAKIFLSRSLMHNKFCIIDNHTILNGSYNWTSNASTNKENIQITRENIPLAKKFEREFEELKVGSKSIDDYFKYSVDQLNNIEKDFENFFQRNKNSKYPYLIKIEDVDISDINKYSKLEKGIYLLTNSEEEKTFYWRIFFLKSTFSIGKIKKILNVKYNTFTILDKVHGAEFNKLNQYNLSEDRYLVETHQRYKYVFFIDKSGSVIGDKVQFTQKLPNGIYLQDFSNWGSKKFLVDINLKKFPIDAINLNVKDEVGIICQRKSPNYGNEFLVGVLDFLGKIYIPFHYDQYEIDEVKRSIKFKEFPLLKLFINEKRVDKVWKDNSDKLPYKEHLFNFSGKLLNASVKDEVHNKNNNPDLLYLFLSENDGKYAELYTALSRPFGTKYPLIREYGISVRSLNSLKRSVNDNRNFSAEIALEVQEKLLEMEDLNHQINKTGKYAKKGSCYIASMVYEDYDHPKTKLLREFRDEVLMSFGIGRYFIRKYYKYSPGFVQSISNKRVLKKLSKLIVDAVVAFIRKTWHNKN